MKRCTRLSGLEAVRHSEEEHGFGAKREVRAWTKRRRPR
jgi:hypothetical protein